MPETIIKKTMLEKEKQRKTESLQWSLLYHCQFNQWGLEQRVQRIPDPVPGIWAFLWDCWELHPSSHSCLGSIHGWQMSTCHWSWFMCNPGLKGRWVGERDTERKRKRVSKLEKVLLGAQVSARSGRLLWASDVWNSPIMVEYYDLTWSLDYRDNFVTGWYRFFFTYLALFATPANFRCQS